MTNSNELLKRLNSDMHSEIARNTEAFRNTIAEVRPKVQQSLTSQTNEFLNLDMPTRQAMAVQMGPEAWTAHVDRMIKHAGTLGLNTQDLQTYFASETPQPMQAEDPTMGMGDIEQELNKIIAGHSQNQPLA